MPRLIPDDALVEITMRTQGARFLMRPSEALNRRLLGILGRALHLYPVVLHTFVFLSNHYHLLARALDGAALSSFLRYLNGELAKAIKAETKWGLKVWQRRATVTQVIDDDAAVARLRYILAHGAKEGLVDSPVNWPGVSSARSLLGEEELRGCWRNRTKASRLRKRGKEPADFEVDHHYPIPLAPLPAWERYTLAERHGFVASMIRDIEHEARVAHPSPLGAAMVLRQDPFGAPADPKWAVAPAAHASTRAGYAAFCVARAALLAAYRQSSSDLKQGRGTFLPAPAFLPGFLYRRRSPSTYVGFTPPAPAPAPAPPELPTSRGCAVRLS